MWGPLSRGPRLLSFPSHTQLKGAARRCLQYELWSAIPLLRQVLASLSPSSCFRPLRSLHTLLTWPQSPWYRQAGTRKPPLLSYPGFSTSCHSYPSSSLTFRAMPLPRKLYHPRRWAWHPLLPAWLCSLCPVSGLWRASLGVPTVAPAEVLCRQHTPTAELHQSPARGLRARGCPRQCKGHDDFQDLLSFQVY